MSFMSQEESKKNFHPLGKKKGIKSDQFGLALSIYISISEQLMQQKFNITHYY